MIVLKPLVWMGSSKKDLLTLPARVIDEFGFGLYLAQVGLRHESSKILSGFGDASLLELIVLQGGCTYRAVYTVRFEKCAFVLHVFQKKSKCGSATPKRDSALIETRLKRAAEIAEETTHDTPKNN